MAKSDARFGYKADLGRQDFDLSQKLGFTSASGMLLPIWEDFASPGDSFYLKHDLPLLRSTNLAAPAKIAKRRPLSLNITNQINSYK